MIPDRRSYALSQDQPILRRNRGRKRSRTQVAHRSESDFWLHFDLDKFARDWQRGIGKAKQAK